MRLPEEANCDDGLKLDYARVWSVVISGLSQNGCFDGKVSEITPKAVDHSNRQDCKKERMRS